MSRRDGEERRIVHDSVRELKSSLQALNKLVPGAVVAAIIPFELRSADATGKRHQSAHPIRKLAPMRCMAVGNMQFLLGRSDPLVGNQGKAGTTMINDDLRQGRVQGKH